MATWKKGQPWRVAKALDRLNAQVKAACPRAVPPATPVTSWGAIADGAHSSTSDHYPHYYAALGATAVVCARDFPHAPKLGLDAHAIAEKLRLSRDPRIGYIISNGRITGPGHGWQWDDYDGSDPHDTHIHVSIVHTKLADDTRDWSIGGDDMAGFGFRSQAEADAVRDALIKPVGANANRSGGRIIGDLGSAIVGSRARFESTEVGKVLVELRAAVAAVASRSGISPAELEQITAAARAGAEAGVAEAVDDAVDEAELARQIITALPPELARQVVAELAAELAA